MNPINLFILAVFTLSGIPILAVSAPMINVEKDYYWVSGRTESEIRNDLNRKTPVLEDGRKYGARTDWFVKWNFWWTESSGLCSIKKVKTSVDVQYTLPKLIRTASMPHSLEKKWETYQNALLQHEEGHKTFGVSAAREIEEEIINMVPRRTCKKLEIEANRLGHKILEKYRGLEREYDRQTNHGVKRGAVFP